MLLVKSRESRSSGNKSSYKSWAWCLLSPVLFTPFKAFADAQSLSNPTSVVSIFMSLLVVIGMVFMLAVIMRRFNVTHTGGGQMKVVASMMAGSKERIIVLQVGDEQHMVGVTAQNINHLAKLDTPLPQTQDTPAVQFKDKLTQALAGKIQSAVKPGAEKQ